MDNLGKPMNQQPPVQYSSFQFNPQIRKYDHSNAVSMALASGLAYETPDKIRAQALAWGFPKFKFLEGSRRISDTQAYIIGNHSAIIVAFRGTEKKLKDWKTDLGFTKSEGPFGYVHEGFNGAFNSVVIELTKGLFDCFDQGQSLWITGHSLGGALATLAAASLVEKYPAIGIEVSGVYTFGSPRVGDGTFREAFNSKLGDRTFRVVNGNDLVPRVPPRVAGYKHVGSVALINETGGISRDPNAWQQLKSRVIIQVNAELLDKEISSIARHLLDGSQGYLAALIRQV